MSENVGPTDCPSFAEISAHLDGESANGAEAHIGSCSACQLVVQSLKTVDDAVAKACQAPAGLAQRVLAACQENSGEPKPVPFWGRPLLRYAAALVLTAALAMAVRTAIGRSGQDGDPDGTVVADGKAVPAAVDSRTPRASDGTIVKQEDLQRVGAGRQTGNTPVGRTTGTRVLAEQIEHVWSVPSISHVVPLLKGQLPQQAWDVKRAEQKAMTVHVTVADEKLQKLVQSMYDKGWQLFSDDLPQPGEAGKVKFSGRRVLYMANFVVDADPQ